jgi:SNF2 family DNA or RNA helicase
MFSDHRGIKSTRLHGGMNNLKRSMSVEMFRADPNIRVFCMSEQGVHGLDLSFASAIFVLEPIWDEVSQDFFFILLWFAFKIGHFAC